MSNDILVPLDGSPLADAAIPHAAELARRTGSGLHLVRVHTPMVVGLVLDAPAFVLDPDLDKELEAEARAWLTRRATEVLAQMGVPVSSEARIGPPAAEIVAAATAHNARLIVCSTHGAGGWAPQWLGSVADGIIRHAPCPVLAMSGAGAARSPAPASVLVLLDGSEVSASILPSATWFAKAMGARIDLLRVVIPPWAGDSYNVLPSTAVDRFQIDPFADAAKHQLDAVAEELRAQGFVVSSEVVVQMSPTRAILEHVERTNPGVVALATHGRGLSRLLMGSVADKVLRASARPTLCYRPPRALIEAAEARGSAAELAGAAMRA